MGRRGPKPKPAALKLLEGMRKDRIHDDISCKLQPASLDAPEWLDCIGREHWDELSPVLRSVGLLTEGDRAALAQLCDDYSTIRKSINPPDAGDVGDYERIRILMTNADKARERYRRMLIEFGLTPASRSRIKVAPEKPADDLGEFLGKKAQ